MTVKFNDLLEFGPITTNQEIVFERWDDGDNLVLSGSAGTGKTFLAMYLGFEEVLDREKLKDRLIIIRSMVPVREMGFLPGSAEEKKEVYTVPYKNICTELFGDKASYNKMINTGQILFESTSFIRGATFDNCVIIIDEMQNLSFHELDSVITRVGNNCRVIFSGDYKQSDFQTTRDKDGLIKFLSIMEQLKNFSTVEFGWDDIVRSDFVRDYIMTKEMLGY
tara:strand:+ start:850 stop:1515 length:666 start_codon:yes stop_codon:yes gene_type:complete